jgi:hypothetical protein
MIASMAQHSCAGRRAGSSLVPEGMAGLAAVEPRKESSEKSLEGGPVDDSAVPLHARCLRPSRGSVTRRDRVELNSIDEHVLVDRPGVCGPLAQRLAVGLAGSPDVLFGDRRERDEFDGVDLDLAGADTVAAALFDARPLPESDRECDVSGQEVVAQLSAERHARDASW